MRGRRIVVAVVGAVVLAGSVGYVVGSAADAPVARANRTALPGFSQVVFLSHANNPVKVPVFPGDPRFTMSTTFTVPEDGFYLQYVKEGEHTGTHYSAPCHFHVNARCADQLDPGDFILPAVVIDVRARVQNNVDYELSVAALKTWARQHGGFPTGSGGPSADGMRPVVEPRDRCRPADVLQLRQRQREVPSARLLESGGEVADQARGPRPARRTRHRHVRSGSR